MCLGCLQNADQESNIEDIARKVREEDYEFDAFKVVAKLPMSLSVRMANFIHMFLDQREDDQSAERDELAKLETVVDVSREESE